MKAISTTGKGQGQIRSSLEQSAVEVFQSALYLFFVPSHTDFQSIVKVPDEHMNRHLQTIRHLVPLLVGNLSGMILHL